MKKTRGTRNWVSDPKLTPENSNRPDWLMSEYEIMIVGIALGGEYARAAPRGWFEALYGDRSTLTEFGTVLDTCLRLEKNPKLQPWAHVIVLQKMSRLARGEPIDSRMCPLIAEWCDRQAKPKKKSGRKTNSPIKKFAARIFLLEMAEARRRAYGVKKQMRATLEDRLGLERSQVSELIGGFDPWAALVWGESHADEKVAGEKTPSDKSK